MKKWGFVVMASLMLGMTGCGDVAVNPKSDSAILDETDDEQSETGEVVVIGDDEEKTEDTLDKVDEQNGEVTESSSLSSVTVTYETNQTSRTMDDGSTYFDISYVKPTVSMDDKDVQDIIQKDLDQAETDFYQHVDEMDAEAKSFYETMSEEGGGYYYEGVVYETGRADGTVISLIRSDSTYSGGAHGYSAQVGINYDAKTGQILTMDNIASDKEALAKCVTDYIYEVCDNGEYKEMVFPDYKDYVASIVADDHWYFSDKGIVFLANPYELGAYAAGTLVFEIGYDEVVGLKEEFKITK